MKSKMILLVIFGVFLIYEGFSILSIFWKEPVDILNEDPSQLQKNMHVETTVELVWDQFIEETTYRTVNGIKVSEEREAARYYALPYLKEENNIIELDKLIGIRVSSDSDECRTIEKILDETNEWWFDTTGKVGYGDTTLKVEGRLREMTEEEKGYLIDYLTDGGGISRSEAEEYIVPFIIVKMDGNTGYILLALGVGFLAIAAAIFFIGRNHRKKAEMAMYQRPQKTAMPSGAYYQPEDGTTAPTAYGSTTYGTNTYGQNTYGQNAGSAYGSTTVTQNANPMYGSTTVTQNANPMYGSTNIAQNADSVYGGIQDASGLSPEFLRRSEEEKRQREAANQAAPVQQNMNPLYGTVPKQDN